MKCQKTSFGITLQWILLMYEVLQIYYEWNMSYGCMQCHSWNQALDKYDGSFSFTPKSFH